MEVRKGYKQTEVGLIPEDWEVRNLDKEIDLLTGFPFSSSLYTTSGIRLLRGSNIKRGVTDWSEDITQYWERLTPELKAYVLNEGDIVIAMDGSLVGRSFARLSKKDLPALLLQRVARIRSNTIDMGYLKEFVCSDYFTKYCDSVKTVTAIPHISPGDIKRFTIPIPPTKAQQEAIAEALSDADSLIESLEKLIAKKRDIKQGAMQQLLTGKKRLPAFSGKWETKKLGDVGKCIRGVSYNGERDLSLHDTDTTVRLFRANNVQNGTIDLNGLQYVNNERVKPIQHLQEKDIVICMANGSKQLVGKSAIFNVSDNYKYTFGAFMGCFRTDPNQAVNNFIAFALQTYQYRFFIAILLSGSSINNLKPSDIESIEIPYPKTEEQTAIVAILSDMDAEIKELEQKQDKYKAIKQGMMQELLTGKTRLI